jgi:hypothetical protein
MFIPIFLLPREILFAALTDFSGFLFNSYILSHPLCILFRFLRKSLNEGGTYGWKKKKTSRFKQQRRRGQRLEEEGGCGKMLFEIHKTVEGRNAKRIYVLSL